MSTLPTFTDEKLEQYLGVWDGLIAQGQQSLLDIELVADYGDFAYPFLQHFTLTYGEEQRELSESQFQRVFAWLEHLREERAL